jgi:outer membrane autotransporter protein
MSRIAAAHEEAAAKSDLETHTAYALPVKAAAKPLKPVSALDVWVEAHFSQFKADDRGIGNNGNFGITYLGADYLVTSSVLVGALVQFDWMTEKSKTLLSNVQGNGVMAGPYASVRLTPNLFFDARAAWGTSDNKVDPFGLYQDKFTTSRWLAHANLTGNWQFGNYRVTPSAGLTYVEETQRSYTDTLGVLIPEQTVALGRFSVGPEIAYRYLAPSGVTYEPHVSVKGVWDFKRPDATSVDGLIVTGNTLSASVETGLLARAPSGWSFRGAVSYDGLGGNNLHAVTGKLWLNIPFH